jgi:hypothetical protein
MCRNQPALAKTASDLIKTFLVRMFYQSEAGLAPIDELEPLFLNTFKLNAPIDRRLQLQLICELEKCTEF